jgi:uncharacterized membrane protein YtjA (UPF0391 family)
MLLVDKSLRAALALPDPSAWPLHCLRHAFEGGLGSPKTRGEVLMLGLSVTLLLVALLAAFLGFGGIAGTAAGLAKIAFFVFLVLAVLSFFFRGARV